MFKNCVQLEKHVDFSPIYCHQMLLQHTASVAGNAEPVRRNIVIQYCFVIVLVLKVDILMPCLTYVAAQNKIPKKKKKKKSRLALSLNIWFESIGPTMEYIFFFLTVVVATEHDPMSE